MYEYFEREKQTKLVFSSAVLAFVFLVKPVVDALYFIGAAKYLYFIVFLAASAFAYIGQRVGGARYASEKGAFGLLYFLLFSTYLIFLVVLVVFKGGGGEEVIRKATPFVTLFLIVAIGVNIPLRAFKFVSLLVVIVNFSLIPTDYGWIYWGGVKTFKGVFFFKTDLAFAVTMALLAYYVSNGRRLSWDYAVVALMVVAMVIVSNSRLNYLLVMMVLVYSALDSGVSLKNLIRFGLVAVSAGALIVGLYDSSKLLSPFDFDDVDRFTQGRNRVWDVLIDVGVYGASWQELFFGQGLRADGILSYQFDERKPVHDAHNELLHLLINQGFIGIVLYISLWAVPIRMLVLRLGVGNANRLCLFVIWLFFCQGLTTVLSSYYSKTWWLVFFILLCIETVRSEHYKKCEVGKLC